MKTKITVGLILLVCLFFAGCSDEYQESFTFTGTVEEILVEEEMLVIKEYGGVNKGRTVGNIYEIPVDDVEKYNIGQKLEVTVFSNTTADVWDLDKMKFDIKTVES